MDKKVLLIGYGNPAREDDGLGPAAAQAIEQLDIDGVTVEADYQLTVEDADDISKHDVVVFIDASLNGREPFSFVRVEPEYRQRLSSHSIEPGAVLGLAAELFNATTDAYVLGIRGYSFSMFREEMTSKALENLNNALDFLIPVLHNPETFTPLCAEQLLKN